MPGIRNSSGDDKFIVYKHTNKINNKVYVGITKRSLHSRMQDGYTGSSKFNNAIKKYGWNNFTSEILEKDLTLQEACDKEKYYINKYDSINNGYNLSEGGIYGIHNKSTKDEMSKRMIGNKLAKGYTHSEETKKRISESIKSMYNDPIKGPTTRKKISNSNKGKVVSKESRLKRSKSLTGRTFSDETIIKMKQSASRRGPVSYETRQKISESLKKFYSSEIEKEKISKRFKGKKKTPEQIEHYRQAALNRSKEHQDKINIALKNRRR